MVSDHGFAPVIRFRKPRAASSSACLQNRLGGRHEFHRDLAAGRLLSQLMVQAFADAERPRALLPVPLHRARLRERGYDQALELAKPLARALRLPLLPDALRRTSPWSTT